MASTDAHPIPLKNVAYRVTFPILDADGDLVTGAATLDSEVSTDGGTFADCTNEATEIATASGMYYLDLTSTEMNADTVAIIVKTSTAGAKTTPIVMYPQEVDDIRVAVTHWVATAVATPTVAGVPEVDVTHFNGTAGTFASGRPEVNTSHAAGTAWNSGAIGAATLATDTITAAKVASDVTTELRALASGTSDSGSTTTMVDAARTEADTDYWAGNIILFTSGTISGQARKIMAFDAATDTITFTPATTQAVSTQTYEILPGARSILAGITHTSAVIPSVTTTDTATAVTTVNGLAANVITAASIATDAIGSTELASTAVDKIWAKAMTELAAVPGVTASALEALEWIFLLARNKVTQTATTQLLRNDADAATIGTSTVSDDGTTFIRGEFA